MVHCQRVKHHHSGSFQVACLLERMELPTEAGVAIQIVIQRNTLLA